MAGTVSAVYRLSELIDGQEAECFAVLVKKEKGTDKNGNPFVRCHFRDRHLTLVAPLWSSSTLREVAEAWAEGLGYRLRARFEKHPRFGPQLQVLECRLAGEADEADGYRFHELVESSRYEPDKLFQTIHEVIDRYIEEAALNRLVKEVLREHGELFKKLQAAQHMHHCFTGGLIEHVWSMTRISSFLAEHYARYYDELNPPLNKGVIVAATILHDIGKIRELEYHPVEAKYTKEGSLIGHVLIGRDMVREAAQRLGDVPEETLLLLEHAILAHHGKGEFGAPIVPKTLEALVVSYVDDLDAKMNVAARERMNSTTDGDFTDKVFALDNRRLYKGIPAEPASSSDGVPRG